ncbi:hypothetical protein [Jannaschia helgolandensis]|jgi:hypothetical protein|uniref:Cell division and transport-associated protein TolA n=1 Tax=Jannaschia helgolandensis TaxID=188906 RepID=A0A1H7J2C1_9RHOB|nr:hypothetical protein [Jannaschia helgolandensis]SEK68756.1 Cell division and transport-associated protein TolA [Jannaschia helgolandensis]
MERRTAVALSGTAHAGLIVWAMVAGLFNPVEDDQLQIAAVSVISSAEFDALVSAAPAPAAPAPAAPAAPEQPETSQAPTPTEEAPPPEPAPTPVTPTPTQPDDTPDVAELVLPQTEVTQDAPNAPTPPADAPDAAPGPRPTPRAAERVSPTPAPAPPPLTETAPTVEAPPAPSDVKPEEPVEPAETPTAPEESAPRIITEADIPAAAEQPSNAPETSSRPPSRPARPQVAVAETPAAPARPAAPAEPRPTETATAAEEPRTFDTSAALAEALGGGTPASPGDPGPQLSPGQEEGFRLAVQSCWDLGAVSTDVMRTVMTVSFEMRPDGFPISSTIRVKNASGGTAASQQIALERAKTAIIQCSVKNQGYDLPEESYAQWKNITITFDPTQSRVR